MAMTREERDFMKQVSDESKEERRNAISAAGPFLDAVRRAQIESKLVNECLLTPTQAGKVLQVISDKANDDDANPQEVIQSALTDESLLGRSRVNKSFAARISSEMAKVVEAGLKERDERIVAAGGPKRPGPGFTLNF